MNPQRNNEFDAIRAQYPLLDEVQKTVKLKRAANEWVGLCPLHNEKTPSFSVNPDKEVFFCQGCRAHGDVVEFVRQLHGLTIPEAIDHLTGGRVAVIAPETQRERDRIRNERDAEEDQRKAAGTRQAAARWERAADVDVGHPYLVRKAIAELYDEYRLIKSEGSNLLIPVYGQDGELQTVQTIPAESGGKKMFAKDAPSVGGRFHLGINMGRTIICEGFATGSSLYSAQSDQVVVAFSADNMERLAREYAERGSFVVLACDQDKGDHFNEVGRELDCAVIVASGPAKGWDFNDEHCAHGVNSVRTQIDAGLQAFATRKVQAKADKEAEEGPMDLWKRTTAPAFPESLLPPLIARFARIRADMVGCDPSGLAMAALGACGTVIRDTIQLKMKKHDPGWKEQARLWVMLVGDPSRKKTPILRAATKRLADLDAGLIAQYNRELQDWNEDKNGPMPVPHRLRISDITMEAAAEVCAHSPDGILALQDELSGWFGGIEKYSGGKGGAKDRSFWLQAFNGGHYATDRIGRKAAFVDNLSISIVGGVQPDPIRRIMSDSTDDGLIQRFFPIMLGDPCPGKDIEMPDVAAEYDELIDKLWALEPPQNFLGPMPLVFSEEAQELRSKLELQHLEMMTTFETINRKIASHIGKYDGMFGRLCIVFHCIEHVTERPGEPLADTIGIDTAKRASTFLHKFLRRHALAFYTNVAGLTDDHDIITDVAGYILAHKLDKVSLRNLTRGTSLMKRHAKLDGERIFEQMAAYGWLEEVRSRADSVMWNVNPLAHTLYADRAETEKTRREEAQARVRDLLAE
jgi:phage/plasmid primase-like uncharacterized protein